MIEKTVVIVKPEHVRIGELILGNLDQYGSRRPTIFVPEVALEVAAAHCAPHLGKEYHHRLLRQFAGNAVMVAVYNGVDIINLIHQAVGATDPTNAAPHTIRGKYSVDSLERAINEDRALQNAVHCSRDLTEAQRDLQVWEPYLGVTRI